MVSWQAFMAQEQQQSYFQKLQQKLSEERASGVVVYPPEHDIFKAFELTPIEQVKIVILGQDPYHQPNQAHGLAFSVPKGVKPPPSLKNIYKAIVNDYPSAQIPMHGDLQAWAEQGVLLLNTSLTVRESAAGSHAKLGWQQFTQNALRYLAQYQACAYLLWGKHAQNVAEPIVANSTHRESSLVLNSVHPSPLSAHRGFLTCGHFRAANKWLQEQGKSPIRWLNAETPESEQYTFL